jgi:hypothetical protein
MHIPLLRLIAVGAVLTVHLRAAPAAAQEYHLGLNGGATYSSLTGDRLTPDGSDGRWGVVLGGFVRYATHPVVSARMEVNWLQKGGTGVTATGADTLDLRLSYLEIPVVLELGSALGRRARALVYGGIALAFRLHCDLGVNGAPPVSCRDAPTPLDPRSTEWSVPLGAALGIDVGGPMVFLDGRYSVGISDVPRGATASLKHRAWQLLLRVAFPLM